jgi:hypothetical protein
MSLEAKAQDESMQSAFRDLEVLMVRAGEMVGKRSMFSSCPLHDLFMSSS